MLRSITILLVLLVSVANAAPSWYLQYPDHIPTGYGQANTLVKANVLALSDLAQNCKIRVQVSSQLKEDDTSTVFTSESNTKSDKLMNGVKTIHQSIEDSLYYVELQYKAVSSIETLASMLHKQKLLKRKILCNTPFQQELESEVGFKVNSSLLKINNMYYFKANNKKVLLKKEDLQKLMFNYSDESSLMLNQNSYYNGDTLYLKIETSKKYVSIFQVDCYGRVTLLYLNEATYMFGKRPSMRRDGAVIDIVSDTDTNYEMFVSVFSDHKILNNYFENISFNIADTSNMQLDALFRLMQDQQFASVKYKVKKVGAVKPTGWFNGHEINKNF